MPFPKLVLALALIAPACSKSSEEVTPAPVPVATAKAGTVVELTGKVTATRAGATRDLALGGEVSSDDVVTTTADASVTIELAHNNARWSLGAGRSGAVKESVAWGLPKAEHLATAVAGDTSAAGRHDEHSAIDTAASTVVTPKTAPAHTTTPTTKPPPPPATGGLDGAPGGGGLGLVGTGQGGGGKGEGIGLGQIGTIGHGGGTGTGTGYGTGNGRLGGNHTPKAPTIKPGTATVKGSVPPEVISRIVRANFGGLRLCYETALQRDPNVHGKVVVTFTIDHTGAVTAATASGFDPTVDTCIAQRFKTLQFPAPADIVQVTYPLDFEPAE